MNPEPLDQTRREVLLEAGAGGWRAPIPCHVSQGEGRPEAKRPSGSCRGNEDPEP